MHGIHRVCPSACWRFLAFVALWPGAPGCAGEGKLTRAVVEVYSDLGPELASVSVQITNEQSGKQSEPYAFEAAAERDPEKLLLSFAVAPPPGDASGSFIVSVRGLDAKGEFLVEGHARGSFIPGEFTTVRVDLNRACQGLECNCPPDADLEHEPGSTSGSGCVDDDGAAAERDANDGAQAARNDAASAVGLDAASMVMTQDAAADAGASPDASGESSCQAITEVCDGTDNDCDGEIDDGVKIRCWADADGDGYASAGATVTETCDACGAKQTAIEPVMGKIDCDDTSATKSPGATDICGDRIDNDCDGTPDDESNNACGGPCSVQLPGKVSDPCNNGQQGACARAGTYECKADHSMVCNAPTVQPAAVDTCGDGSDNDCDGHVDEDGLTWYPDCDGDGFGGGGATKTSCSKPASATRCASWVSGPIDNMDCDDGNAFHYPGATYNLGLPTPAFSDGNGVWQALSLPFPDTKLFDGDVNCDGRVEQILPMFERKTESSTESMKYHMFPACTSQNRCATEATSDQDECYEYSLTTSVTQCGLVPFFISYKDELTDACVRSDENLYIVCR